MSTGSHLFSLDTPTGVHLEGERSGSGVPVILLHGLTATRRYVVMGSRHLARAGAELIAFDARGHGESGPAPDSAAYEYADMVGDLEAVAAVAGAPAVLIGNSMGAATAAAYALKHPEQVAALVQVTPGFRGGARDEQEMGDWNALADGLERDGVDGFMEAYQPPADPRFREAALRFTRQRLERHRHPEAVVHALRVVPRSVAFEGLDALGRLEMPALVVGSRDDSDPGHPLELARAYAEALPGARLLVEEPGESPLAWQGAQLSRAIEGFLREAGLLGSGEQQH
jgi:pimeloyl-ACP methyl ester carboxylesterase